MIEINLLPEELRVREKRITGMRLVLFLGIPCLSVLVFFWAWLHFVKYPQAKKELADLTVREAELRKQAEEVRRLEQRLKEMKTKEQTIAKLKGLQKVQWVKKLMELTKAVDPTEGWLTSVRFTLAGNKGNFTIGCAVTGRDRKTLRRNVQDFLDHLGYKNGDRSSGEPSDFWKGFISHTPDYYYKGIENIQEVGGWKLTTFTLRLEIESEVASSINVEGIK